MLAIYCNIGLCTIRRDDNTKIFLQETRKKNKDVFSDWRDDNTKIFFQETRKRTKMYLQANIYEILLKK